MEKEDEFELLSIRYPRVSNSQFCVHILSWQMSVIIVAVSTSDIFRYLVWRNIKHFIPLSLSLQCCIYKTKMLAPTNECFKKPCFNSQLFRVTNTTPNCLISYFVTFSKFSKTKFLESLSLQNIFVTTLRHTVYSCYS